MKQETLYLGEVGIQVMIDRLPDLPYLRAHLEDGRIIPVKKIGAGTFYRPAGPIWHPLYSIGDGTINMEEYVADGVKYDVIEVYYIPNRKMHLIQRFPDDSNGVREFIHDGRPLNRILADLANTFHFIQLKVWKKDSPIKMADLAPKGWDAV